MLAPQQRALSAFAGIGLLLCAAVFFFPGSQNPALTEADDTEAAVHDSGASIPANGSTGSPMSDGSAQLDEAKAARRDLRNFNLSAPQVWNSLLAVAKLQVVDLAGLPVAGARMVVLPKQHWTAFTSVERVVIMLDEDTGELEHVGVSGVNGMVEVGDLPMHSDLRAVVLADGFAAVEFEFQTDHLHRLDLGQLMVGPSVPVEVQMVQQSGAPVAHSRIGLSLPKLPPHFPTTRPAITDFDLETNADGIALFEYLPPVPVDGYGLGGQMISLTAKWEVIQELDGVIQKLRIVVPDFQWAEGVAKSFDGQPMEGVHITLHRLSHSEWKEETPLDELLEKTPGYLWNSHSWIENYRSRIRSNADGKFRAPIPLLSRNGEPKDPPFLISATCMMDETVAKSFKLQPADQPLELIMPEIHTARGMVVDEQGQTVPGAKVYFHQRLDPLVPDEKESASDWTFIFRNRTTACAEDGSFSKLILPGCYWLEVLTPGGSHRFEGPYRVNDSLDLGAITIRPGRKVRLTAVPVDSNFTIQNLEGDREFQPMPYDKLQELRRRMTPWGESDRSWRNDSAGASVDGNVALWSNEPDGSWRYILAADGAVPAIVDLDLGATTGDVERTVVLRTLGHIMVNLQELDGSAAVAKTLKLQFAKGVPPDPIHQELEDSIGHWDRTETKAQTDENGVARFRDVIPGTYQIVALETRERHDYGAPPADENREPIATFEVASSETTVVDASLAQMGSVELLVLGNGQPVVSAEVFAVQDRPELRQFEGDVLAPKPAGFTDQEGRFVFSSLAPNAKYTLGARRASSSSSYGHGDAWTVLQANTVAGSQQLTLNLSTAEIRLRVEGDDLPDEVEVYITKVKQPIAVPESETAKEERRRLRRQFRDDIWARHSERYGMTVAEREVAPNREVAFLHFPPGEYRAMAMFDHRQREARVVSEPFVVEAGGSVNIGTLRLIELVPFKVSFFGFEGLTEEQAEDLDAYIFPVGSSRSMEDETWVSEGNWENWMLPPGEYELAMYFKMKEVARSERITVSPTGAKKYDWHITNWDFGE
jgi:hypothetical protein